MRASDTHHGSHDQCGADVELVYWLQTPLFDDSVHFDFWSEPPKRRRGSSSSSPPDETAYVVAHSSHCRRKPSVKDWSAAQLGERDGA
jgi:hypothetical protein